MKSARHEKSRILIYLIARADGRELKPMIAFKGTVR